MSSGNFVSIFKDKACPPSDQPPAYSDNVSLENHMVDLLLSAICTAVAPSTSGTITFTLEHSPDAAAFSAVTDSAGEVISFECTAGTACQVQILDTPLLPHIRATCIQSSTGDTIDCNLNLYYRTQK